MAENDPELAAAPPARTPGAAQTSLSERLVTAPSWPGALLVMVLALLLIVGLPQLASLVHGGGYPVGEPFEAAPGLQVTVEEGWEYDDSSGLFYTFSRGGASLILVPAVAADGSLDDAIQPSISGLEGANYVVTEPQSFTTAAGDAGIVVSGHTDADAQASWIIEHDGGRATFFLSGPQASFPEVYDAADAIVQSAVILEVTP